MSVEIITAVIGAVATVLAAILGNISKNWKPGITALAFSFFTILIFSGLGYHGYKRFESVCGYIDRYTDSNDSVFEENKIERSESSQSWFKNVAEECF